jgi:thiol-disulfide isomerase/thioredoxin
MYILRQIFISLFLFGALSFASLYANATAKPAPDFTIELPGLPSSLTGLKGKVVYVDFWASWCKPCRKSFPWMNAMQQKYAQQGLQIITINLDTDAELAKEFLAMVEVQLPIIYDPKGEIATRYQLLGMPSSYLLDSQGNIRASHKGFFTDKQALYEQQVLALLAEREQ